MNLPSIHPRPKCNGLNKISNFIVCSYALLTIYLFDNLPIFLYVVNSAESDFANCNNHFIDV